MLISYLAKFLTLYALRERRAHRLAAALLMGGGWEVERLQDNALAIVDEAASGELICLRLAD